MHRAEPNVQLPTTFRWGALIVAAVGLVLSILGLLSDIDLFFQVYLIAYLVCLELALGCLGLLLLAHLVNSRWTFAVERLAAAGARTLPLLAVLFLPLLFGLDRIYPWATPEALVGLEGGKAIWMQPAFFIARAVLYFVIWIWLSFAISNLSYRHDASGDDRLLTQASRVSILGMILYMLTTTFAAFDFSMSFELTWFSSVYGWLSLSRSGLAVMAFVLVVLGLLWENRPFKLVISNRVLTDLGTLLLVSLMVWVYLTFIQFIVYWSGNLPSKIAYYVERTSGGWDGIIFLIILFHFLMFVLLLIPGIKKVRWVLMSIAGLLLFLRLVDMYWTVLPNYQAQFGLQLWALGLPLAIGGAWFALFIWLFGRQSPLPTRQLETVLAEQEEEHYGMVG